MMKTIIAVCLVLVLTLTFAACGEITPAAQLPQTVLVNQTDGTENVTTQTTTDTTNRTTQSSLQPLRDRVSVKSAVPTTVKSFEQFKEQFEQTHQVTTTKTSGVVEIQVIENDQTTKKGQKTTTTRLAIPTMPKTTKATTKRTTASTNPTTSRTTKKPVPQFTYMSNQTHTALPYTERYMYNLLNEEQQSWYRAIDKAVKNLDASADFDVDMTKNKNYYIYFLYMADNPQYFFLGNTLSLHNDLEKHTSIHFCYAASKDFYCSYGHTPSYPTEELKSAIREKQAIFDREVARILSTIPANAPDVWKERLIYDRILIDGQYNLGAQWRGIAEDNWTAYGLLVNKYGVCESYSEAFQTLCQAVGIDCIGVVGSAGGGHKWNAVKLDNEWYMCDITFDDPIGGEPGGAYHFYFNRTSEEFQQWNHDWSNCDWPVPACTGEKYAFSNYFHESAH